MDSPEILFRGHACIQINFGETTLLCDPWFSGGVFNNSWRLLRDHDLDWSTVQKTLSIWISHEHPDHLHFASLREIRTKHRGEIRLYFRAQKNKNVRDELIKLGFQVIELHEGEPLTIAEGLELCSFDHGSDSACVFKIGDRTILNQNDCLLTAKSCRQLKRLYPKIDLWFFQFSLAGYYGNEGDSARLKAAHDRHIELVKNYFALLQPRVYCPFASFVRFSKSGNQYLNSYRVCPAEIVRSLGGERVQILWFDHPVLWEKWEPRNAINLQRWAEIWNEDAPTSVEPPPSDVSVLEFAKIFAEDLRAGTPALLRPREALLQLRESKRYVYLNFSKGFASLVTQPLELPIAEVGDDDLLFFFKFPWGADTLNITGNLKIYRHFAWRRIAYLKHCGYVMKSRPRMVRALIANAGAAVRSLQFRFGRTV